MALVGEHRLVTVTGPGGVGKTRLVKETAARSDGVRGPRFCRPSWATCRRVPTSTRSASSSACRRPRRWRSASASHRRSSCSTTASTCSTAPTELVRRFLAADDCTALVTTSRQPLGITGERVVVLEPLAPPAVGDHDPLSSPAVALFFDRATASGASWARSEETIAAVAELCRRVDGLPARDRARRRRAPARSRRPSCSRW